jgi:hypothetical protein
MNQNIKTWQERMPAPRTEMQCVMNCYPRHGVCNDCEPVTIYGDPVAARDAEIAELRAACAHRPAAASTGGHCKEGDRCVCGGDLPRVREGCGNWVKGGA